MSEEAEVPSTSPDPVEGNIEKLKAIFPEAVTEDGIDAEVLLQLLGEEVAEGDEKYGLSWHGKKKARQLALTPSAGTLRPAPEDSVDWDTTQNLMIEGDNLEVLKLLQKSYAGKVKLIYIDPPYNTGKDFVYPDNFKDSIGNYLALTGQVDEEGNKISSNTESSGRFHTDWLNMMYPRLKLARELLREDGVLMVSIDDGEVANLRLACSEIFGASNLIAEFVWKKGGTGKNDSRFAVVEHEYIVMYAVSIENASFRLDKHAEVTTQYNRSDERGDYSLIRLDSKTIRYNASLDYEIVGDDGVPYRPEQPEGMTGVASWRWSRGKVERDWSQLVFERGFIYTKNYKKDGALPRSLLASERFGVTRTGRAEAEAAIGEKGVFDYPKPVRLLKHLVAISTDGGDLTLDFFAGSGTTGHAVMAQNAEEGGDRRYIMVQLPEPLDPDNKDQKVAAEYCDELGKPRTIAELTKERLRRAAKKIKQENPDFEGDLGFRVFKLDSSNIRSWDPQPDDLDRTLEESVITLKDDRDEQDVLYEVLLKLGLDLCVPIETKEIASTEVHSVGAGTLFACLADELSAEAAEELGQGIVSWKDEIDPAGETTCLFRDSAFPGDVAKTNLNAILEQGGIETVRSI